MPAPTLVIGVGGTGLRVLLRVKERFIEAYDKLPAEVILLELDTDPYRGPDREDFNGVQLLIQNEIIDGQEVMADEAEFYYVMTKNEDMMVDKILEEDAPEWQWVDKVRIGHTITAPNEKTITSGAHTVRPIGKAALYLDYGGVYGKLKDKVNQLVSFTSGDEENKGEVKGKKLKDEKRGQIFIASSVAGGSGAGMVLDILQMLEHMRIKIPELKNTTRSCLLIGGSCFVLKADGQRTLSNTFAALRELDRLGAIAGKQIVKAVPSVMMAPDPVGRLQSDIGPADNIYLFDRPDRFGRSRGIDRKAETYLDLAITPTVADFILAMADGKFSPKFKSLEADFKTNVKNGPKGEIGHYPYMSAGVHTLIFPERDVRWSAGFKLLNYLWDEYLVRPEDVEVHHNAGNDLEPITANTWGLEEDGVVRSKLTPYLFAGYGFQRDTVCKNAANNSFIKTIVTCAINGEITLPSKYKNLLSWFTGARTMLARVWALIGAPSNISDDNTKLMARAERVAEWFDGTIDRLDQCNDKKDIDDWRRTYWGPGPVGSEELDKGEWIAYLENNEIIKDHKEDFLSVILSMVKAILNDKDETGRVLPYRLEYARRVLDKLSQYINNWLYAKDQQKGQRSLLAEYFDPYSSIEENKREKLRATDPDANFGRYKGAMVAYAKARREMFAMELLKFLCEDLQQVIKNMTKELDGWRTWLRGTGNVIKVRQSKHEADRKEKAKIPVRTYVTNANLEKTLYEKYQVKAADVFRTAIEWERDGEGGFYLAKAAFSKLIPDLPDNPSAEDRARAREQITLDKETAADRAIRWACTCQGNLDRQDFRNDPKAEPPLRTLGSPSEVDMSARIVDHFGKGNTQTLVDKLTNEEQIASMCNLPNWPPNHLIFFSGVPRYTSDKKYEDAYDLAFKGIKQEARGGRFYDRSLVQDELENPRFAFGMEIAAGFRLEDRKDYDMYLNTYLKDLDAGYALHCFSEETNASSYFEQIINRTKIPNEPDPLYGDLKVSNKLMLNPVVVDILGDRGKLELFVKARALKLISVKENSDFYLYPNDTNPYRLSRMNEISDRDRILNDLVINPGRITVLTEIPKLVNRMRLFYALRTFMLLGCDLDDEKQIIDYVRLAKDVSNKENGINRADLIEAYQTLVDNYKGFYRDYSQMTTDNLDILAHLGLVLAKVAYDCLQYHAGKVNTVPGDEG